MLEILCYRFHYDKIYYERVYVDLKKSGITLELNSIKKILIIFKNSELKCLYGKKRDCYDTFETFQILR